MLATRPRAEWTARFHAASVPCGAVRDVAEVLADPQLQAREMIGTLPHPTVGAARVIATPIKLSQTPGRVARPAPLLGEHTREVLEEYGFSAGDIDALYASGAAA